ncbi:hypothetical protein DXB71_12615 [Blautia sp. OM05-6]|jgi:hypothetical protein|nr:hypothetical protein [Blautia sp. OM05-6]RHV23267.1 hypothetical protein DXB71_12615 [Blautia sp. OM05-6]
MFILHMNVIYVNPIEPLCLTRNRMKRLNLGLKAYVNRIIKRTDGVVNKTFVQMMESLGYDIELTYVKRKK